MSITVDAMTLKHALAFASALYHVEQVRFVVADNKLSIKSVDTGNVAMAHSVIPVGDCPDFTVGVDIAVFLKALGTVYKSEPRTIELDVVKHDPKKSRSDDTTTDEQPYRLKICSPPYTHTLKYVNPHIIRKDPKIPKLELDNHVSISPKVVHTALGRTFGEHVIIANLNGEFNIKSNDDDEDSSKYKSRVGVFGAISDTTTLISMESLAPIIVALKQSSDLVVISHSQDYPIMLEATFGKDDQSTVQFLIAPRIEDVT